MANYCKITLEHGTVICHLPITLPTSKVRVKRERMPIPVCQTPLLASDEGEWQISYQKSNGETELVELGLMLQYGLRVGLILADELQTVLNASENMREFFDTYAINLVATEDRFLGEYELLREERPVIRKVFANGHHADAILSHRQRAVGYQPMLFIYIPVGQLAGSSYSEPIINRPARTKEIVYWRPKREIIVGLVRMFAVLSESHNRDIQAILRNILNFSTRR